MSDTLESTIMTLLKAFGPWHMDRLGTRCVSTNMICSMNHSCLRVKSFAQNLSGMRSDATQDKYTEGWLGIFEDGLGGIHSLSATDLLGPTRGAQGAALQQHEPHFVVSEQGSTRSIAGD